MKKGREIKKECNIKRVSRRIYGMVRDREMVFVYDGCRVDVFLVRGIIF